MAYELLIISGGFVLLGALWAALELGAGLVRGAWWLVSRPFQRNRYRR